MAKKIVADGTKFSTVSVEKERNTLPVAPDMKVGDALSASVPKKRYRSKDIEDEILVDKGLVVAAAEQAAPDSAFAAAEPPLLAQSETLTPGREPDKTRQADASSTGGNAGWWWMGAGVVAVGAGIGVGISGGGGGEGSSNNGSTTTITGTVTDGPVQGARLYVDVDGNGRYGEGTDTAVLDSNGNQVVTDALGNFSFTVTGSGAGIKLVTQGGTDTVTGETVTLNLSAPAGYSQINPITSAIAAYMEANPGVTAAQAEVAVESALGLPDLDYSTVNLADPPAGLAAADILAAQQAVAILATAAIIIEQSGTNTDAFQYIAENLGVSGSTSALVTAVQSADPSSAAQLADTVAAIEAATDLDTIGAALNNNFFADVVTSGILSVGQTVNGDIGLGNTTGLDVAYQWQSSADGSSWTDIPGATGNSYLLTQGEAGEHIRMEAVYTDTAGVVQTAYSSDMGVVPALNAAPELGDYTVTLAENSANGASVQTVAATDVDGDALSYSITAGNASGAFEINAATGAITVADVSKLNFETTPNFSLTVQASDGTATDTGTIAVNLSNVNEGPVITSASTGTVAENAATSTAVYTAAVTDADAGDTRTYSLSGTDAALFNIDATSGAITLKSSANYEAATSYAISVIATDAGGLTATQAVTVNVTNVNEAPAITSASTGTVAENAATSTAVYTAAATDADAGDTRTYSLSGTEAALFNIDATSGAVTLKNSANYEAATSYAINVIATDAGGLTATQAVTVNVTNVNEAPIITSASTGTVAENAATSTVVYTAIASDADAGDTRTYSLSGTDAALFNIDANSGAVTLKTSANYEAGTSYAINVVATDAGGLTATQAVTVNVTNVNEAPTITSASTGTVAENAATSTVVYTAVATDADAGSTINYSLSGTDAALFNIDAASGAVTLQNSADYETATSYAINVIATDAGGLTATQAVTINVTNVNEAPTITSASTGTVAENAATSTVVHTAAATDADAGDTRTYSLSGTDAALFDIDATSGAVTLKTSANYEASTIYAINVVATDAGGLTATQAVTVNVTDLNDNTPTITSGGAGSVIENAATSTVIYDAAATDADAGTTITYSLKPEGPDFSLITIDPATGEVTLNSSADYENRASYSFTVIASDGTNSSEQAVTVNVTNVHESVVVYSTGVWIDLDGNGVLDIGDTTAADFTAGTGNIDLAANPITIHFNDVPDTPLDLTGFTSDDKIEIDISAFNEARMRTSPAHSFNSLSTSTNAVYLSLGNQDYYSVFLAPKTLPSLTENKGAFAFYTSTINYLAYWNDLSNPLGNMSNILPSDALSALNLGAGHGVLIDFIWTPATSFPETAVVVESTGAWIDSNADGVHDANETTPWVGGSDNLAGHQVTIHFNNAPDQPLDLAGFGSDDLIEIDTQAFINNGHNALNILSRPNILKTDEFSVPGTLTSTSNILSHSGLGFANWYTTSNGSTRSARVGLFNSSSSLYFTSNNGSQFTSYQLATGVSTNLPLQQMVNFVNFPEPPTTVHVVVERDGAVIDYDGDGVRDSGENRLAVFSADGNADLAGTVIVHFNDLPLNALDLTGFGTNDKIEFDVGSLQGNNVNVLNPTAAAAGLGSLAFEGLGLVGYYFSRTTGTSPSITTRSTWIRVNHSSISRTDFNGNPHGGFGLTFNQINTSINSRTRGLIAYWTDSSNALNSIPNLLPDYVGTPTNNNGEVLANLNNNHYSGLVEFVWPVNVVVDDQAGNVATFIDANGNGVRDLGEDTLAMLGQTQADVDAFNAAAGTAYVSQVVDLASEQVTIHYNDLPTGAWVPDLTGFDGNDRIQIDVAAMRNITMADTVSLNAQPTRTMSSQTQVYAGVSGVSSGSTAIYISGGNLKFGHRTTTTSTIGSSAVFNAYYTATGALEGVIASNAGALANHFQQVAFVTAIL